MPEFTVDIVLFFNDRCRDENSEGEQAEPELQVKTKSKINKEEAFLQEIQQDLQKSVKVII